MDYIQFELSQEGRIDDLKIKFGSGLQSRYPGISPLNRNLKNSLYGDETIEIEEDEMD